MLSLQFIRDNIDAVRAAAERKNVRLDLDGLLALDGQVRGLKSRIDELRRQRNELSAGFKTADPADPPSARGIMGRAGPARPGPRAAARSGPCRSSRLRLQPRGQQVHPGLRRMDAGLLAARPRERRA